MTVLLRDDFTGSGNVAGRTPDGVHTGAWADDSYFGGAASNTNITGGTLVPLTPYRFGASIDLAGSPTNAYIEVGMLTADVTYPAGAKTIIGLGSTIGSGAVGVFCSFKRVNVSGSMYLDLDLLVRHSDYASGTTSLVEAGVGASGDDFRVRLEVQGNDVAVLMNGRYLMRAVLNAPMAAGRAFIGSEFADTKFGWVQAGFLPVYAKPPLLNLSGTFLLEKFESGDGAGLQYNPPEFSAGAFAGVNYYSSSANDARDGGWAVNLGSGSGAREGVDTNITPYYGGGALGVSEVTADIIFRTAEGLPSSYATSQELVRLSWQYDIPNVEEYDVSVYYLTGADATSLVGGGAVAGHYLKVRHYAPTAGVNPAVNRYTALPAMGQEEVHSIRVDQFRSAPQLYFFDGALIDTTTKPTAAGVHKLSLLGFVGGMSPASTGLLVPPLQIGGVRFMPVASLLGPPYFWRDLIACTETR